MYFIISLRVFLLTILSHSFFSSLSFQYVFLGTKNVGTWSKKLSLRYCSLTNNSCELWRSHKLKNSVKILHIHEQKKVSDRPKSESRILVCPFTVQRQLSDKFSAIYSRPWLIVLCCKVNFTFLEFHERFERYRVYQWKRKTIKKAVVTETRNATKKNECLLSFFRSV